MFCDLVGSTALASRLDPEDLRDVIGAYHRCVAETVRRFDGFLAKYMGDGVLVYFGYPAAHEDDAERAVRAGLAVVDAVGHLVVPEEVLRVRIGIATGLVVVGDLIGVGAAQEQAVVGETPNLAARLQALAKPNAVVIAQATHRLTGGLFQYENLGAVEVKGFAERVPAWRVFGESAVENRFEALPSGGETPLVGREEEIELLLRRWQRAKSGRSGCTAFGEPGIGKSRITAALLSGSRASARDALFLLAAPPGQRLHPTIAQLERAGLAREIRRDQLTKLEALLAATQPSGGHGTSRRAVVDPGRRHHRYPAPNLTPQRRRSDVRSAVAAARDAHAATAGVDGL
jgi:class 3 adenylate cyclase